MTRLFLALVVFCAALLAGCASTATGSSRSALLAHEGPLPAVDVELPSAGTLVVVRYPAILESDAADAYYSAYVKNAFGGRVGGSVYGSPEARQVADGVFLKSNYFAQSIYRELSERLPKEGVLLSPHRVILDEDGTLTSVPITQAESLPSALSVDFVSYSFPDPDRMMNAEPLTFGDLFSPLVTVHADHRVRTPTHGVVLASAPLLGSSGGAAREDAMKSLSALERGSFESEARPLDFIHHLSGEGSLSVASQGLSVFSKAHAVQVYPLEKIVIDRYALRQMKFSPNTQLDPIERAFTGALADRIVAQLAGLDIERASMVGRAAAIERFDPSLAALALVGSADMDVQTRLRFAERLLEAERRFLAVQSKKIHEGVLAGEIGQQMRDVLVAEFDLIERRRQLARQQNMATAAAIAGVVAAGAVAANSGDNFDAGDFLAVDLLSDLAVISAMQAFNLNSQNKAAGVNFLQSMVPALEEQITVQVELLDSNEAISAIRFEDFRGMLQERYANSQRSIDSVSARCGFVNPDAAGRGVWQGECAGGLAEGVGVGVLKAGKSAIEYFGHASDGQPDGLGYMIIHGDTGNMAIEGSFLNGEPDGVMKVSRAGQTSRQIVFRNGQEVGPAPAGQKAPELFNAQSNTELAAYGDVS
ncbi:MAG: hypothetical protein AAFR33_00500 [Pseudomonadota bacterium]